MATRITITEMQQRFKEMLHLRFVERWTLQQIADKYNMTRERVRQIIGNTGWVNKKEK